jgi:para-nitrobenzyl esterase
MTERTSFPIRGRVAHRALALLTLALLATAAEAGSSATVHTDAGTVRGRVEDDVLVFRGIPYAAPPVGPLRWRAPQPVARWTGVRDAGSFGDACVQPAPRESRSSLGAPTSEDCLYVNVWRPNVASAPLPVMVWIHGGSLITGAASQPASDGARFARRGVVLVSINYRLGRLGFFSHPVLTREGADGGRVGNYGLMDQIAALRWVKRNARAFGGDPSRVTIFGQSAGGASVLALMVSPEARGLFQRAISQSGYGRGSWPRPARSAPDGQPPADAAGESLLRGIGVDVPDAAALRALPLAKLLELPPIDPAIGATFVVDGHVLREDLWTAWRAGREAPVPFVIGATSQEAGFPVPASFREARDRRYDRWVRADERARLVDAYGGPETFEGHFGGDLGFAAHAWSFATLRAERSRPTWRYRFAAMPDAAKLTLKGVPHSGDVPYAFGTLDTLRWPAGPRDRAVSDAVMAYWVEFARTGRPAPPSLPAWPAATGDAVMLFTDEGPQPGVDDRAPRYRALAAFADPRS